MRASIIIPAYNAGRTIANTLRACLDQDFPEDQYEIIVVDDGSKDDTAEKVQRFPVKLICQSNAGAAAARNAGADAARGALLVFFDADCSPPPDALTKITSVLNKHAEVGMVGGIYAPATDDASVARAINEEIRYRHVRSETLVQHLGSFCMAIHRELFEKIGRFDPRFRRAQDHELSARVIASGYELRLLKDVVFNHDHSRTLWAWLKNQFRQAYWRSSSVLRHSQVLKGDGYVNYRDWLALMLGALTLALIPLVWLPYVPWVLLAGLVLSAVLHIPVAVFAIRDTGDWRLIAIVPLQILRGFAWAAGAVTGVLSRLTNGRTSCDEHEVCASSIEG